MILRKLMIGVLCATAVGSEQLQPADLQTAGDIPTIVTAPLARAIDVRWGGVVVSIMYESDDTWVEMLAFSLLPSGRPDLASGPTGRFYTRIDDVLDPAVYHVGRQVTVSGNLERSLRQSLGGEQYAFPVVHASHVELWNPAPPGSALRQA